MTEPFVVRAVVLFLGIVTLAGLGVGGALSFFERSVPDFIIASTSASLGALTGVLASTRTGPNNDNA